MSFLRIRVTDELLRTLFMLYVYSKNVNRECETLVLGKGESDRVEVCIWRRVKTIRLIDRVSNEKGVNRIKETERLWI